MGDSKPFTTATHYALLVMMVLALLYDFYVGYTRVAQLVRYSANVAKSMNTFIVSTVGYTANAFVVVGVIGNKKMRASPVNMLLLNLSMSDFTYIVSNDRIGIHDWPAWMTDKFWWLPGWVCPVNRYISSAAFMASIGNFVAIAIERYVVTVRPLRARSLCSRSKLIYWVLTIWIFAFVFELPNYVGYGTYDAVDYYDKVFNIRLYERDTNSTESDTIAKRTPLLCISFWRFAPLWKVFKWAEFCVTYICPIVVAVALYPRTCRAVWAVDPGFKGKSMKVVTGSTAPSDESRSSDSYDKDRRQIVKMLIACVVIFFVGYTPIVVIFVRSNLYPYGRIVSHNFETTFILIASELIVYVCAFNPFIYTLFSSTFRQRVKEILTCRRTIDVFGALMFLIGFYVAIQLGAFG